MAIFIYAIKNNKQKEVLGMGKFIKYQHIQRYGTFRVLGIEQGRTYIFPKLDGANSTVWCGDSPEDVRFGNRNKELLLEDDSNNFYLKFHEDENIRAYLKAHPTHRLYGEQLESAKLQTYREDAVGKFYVFDVCIENEQGNIEYLPYEVYKPLLEEFGLNYIVPLAIIENATYEDFEKWLNENVYLVEEGKGLGEGIVVKNYAYKNSRGEILWAKILTKEFLDKHRHKAQFIIEEDIVAKYCTVDFIEKEFDKLITEKGDLKKCMPILFDRIFEVLIEEEIMNIIVKYKAPVINFSSLKSLVVYKIKETKSDIFGKKK